MTDVACTCGLRRVNQARYCVRVTQVEADAVVRALAEQVRALRAGRGWSAQRLADEMTRKGIPWERTVVANLENGRRRFVTVTEWLVLAVVLQVAPIHLVVPPDAERFDVAGDEYDAADVRAWIRGELPLTTDDAASFFRHQPYDKQAETARTIAMLRLQSRLLPEGGSMLVDPDGTVHLNPGAKLPTRGQGGDHRGEHQEAP